jgi:hypothetical protein
MMRWRATAGLLAAACTLLLWPAAPPAQQAAVSGTAASGVAGQIDGEESSPRRALASNGAIIAMPELSGLDCSGMAEVLGLIDQSRYRGPEPVPEDHPDREIFEYEHRLAAAHYHACIMSGSRLDDPGPAFSQGFEQP